MSDVCDDPRVRGIFQDDHPRRNTESQEVSEGRSHGGGGSQNQLEGRLAFGHGVEGRKATPGLGSEAQSSRLHI